eukprot:jgi/Hompol1/2637/HPOL_006093-RA
MLLTTNALLSSLCVAPTCSLATLDTVASSLHGWRLQVTLKRPLHQQHFFELLLSQSPTANHNDPKLDLEQIFALSTLGPSLLFTHTAWPSGTVSLNAIDAIVDSQSSASTVVVATVFHLNRDAFIDQFEIGRTKFGRNIVLRTLGDADLEAPSYSMAARENLAIAYASTNCENQEDITFEIPFHLSQGKISEAMTWYASHQTNADPGMT